MLSRRFPFAIYFYVEKKTVLLMLFSTAGKILNRLRKDSTGIKSRKVMATDPAEEKRHSKR